MEEKITSKNYVEVTNRNNGTTGYTLSSGLHRDFNLNETKKIDIEELNELMVVPGGEYLLRNYLMIKDKSALEYLDIETEPEYFYTEAEIKKLLLEGNLDQLEDCLNFAPQGVIDLVKSLAVSLEIPDIRKRELIQNKTGFSVDNAIRVNKTLAEDAPSEEVAAEKTRKAEPIKTEEKKIRKYNIVT